MPKAKPERKAPCGTIAGVPGMRIDWRTPPHILEAARRYFGGPIPFDPATHKSNPTEATAYCARGVNSGHKLGANGGEWVARDGLAVSWNTDHTGARGVWVNPPYGKVLRDWLEKVRAEAARGLTILALLPCARWEQSYLTDCLREANAVAFLRGRVNFINPDTGDAVGGNPYANMILGFNVVPVRFRLAFEPCAGSPSMTAKGVPSACFELRAL